jgi:hypothetical protein
VGGGAPAAKEHQDSNKPAQAVLGKNTVYREKGTQYLRAQDGRGVYRNFSHGHLEKIRDLARSVAEFQAELTGFRAFPAEGWDGLEI